MTPTQRIRTYCFAHRPEAEKDLCRALAAHLERLDRILPEIPLKTPLLDGMLDRRDALLAQGVTA